MLGLSKSWRYSLANYRHFVARRCNFVRRSRAHSCEQAGAFLRNTTGMICIRTQASQVRTYCMQHEKSAILYAAASLPSCVSSIRTCVRVRIRLYARDRYAIAREPTESMKIKRDYSSPSEVKDALECCDATQCNARQCDMTRPSLSSLGRTIKVRKFILILSHPFSHFFNKLIFNLDFKKIKICLVI